MPRTILDEDLRRWEVYATTGRYGFPEPSRIVFRCVSSPDLRARAWEVEGDKSDAEKVVVSRPLEELREMLDEAGEID